MEKGKKWRTDSAGYAVATHSWQGKFGNCVVWKIDNGTYVTTSSADHHVDDYFTIAARNVIGLTADPDDMSGDIKETVVFMSDKDGRFYSRDSIATFFAAEQHFEAMKFAGFTPETVPAELPRKEKPSALF